jgi:tRNA (guanine-N7-)-methyltransferase
LEFDRRTLTFAGMGQKKLIRFEALLSFNNVLQYPENMPGTWHNLFGNNNPITLELACGKGEYAVGLAQLYPNRNFIGADVKGNRIWVGAKQCIEKGLNNVLFLRTQIDRLEQYFNPGEVSEIWITFPDPQLRWSKMKKRLTHPKFLRLYQKILAPGGTIHLKTDSPDLYEFTKKVIELCRLPLLEDMADVHNETGISNELRIKTHYEGLNISGSHRIFYLRFKIEGEILPVDETLKNLFRKDEPTG